MFVFVQKKFRLQSLCTAQSAKSKRHCNNSMNFRHFITIALNLPRCQYFKLSLMKVLLR